jgi:hypothetical protein
MSRRKSGKSNVISATEMHAFMRYFETSISVGVESSRINPSIGFAQIHQLAIVVQL